MQFVRVFGLGKLVAVAAIALAVTGCEQGGGTSAVQFPDVSKLPQPKEVVPGKGKAETGVSSKGDPAESSRAN